MFFSKIFVSAVAVLTAATGVFASPVASSSSFTDIVKRGGSPTDVCQHAYDSCHPYIGQITPSAPAAVVEIAVDAMVNIFAEVNVALNAYVDVNVDAEIVAIVNISVKLIAELLAAIQACASVSVAILAKIDLFIKAYLAILAKINVAICSKIVVDLPVHIKLFIFAKLTLVVNLLALLNIGLSISL
ncbi:hypothetical protein EIP91_005401 [Steccherinum ochraceum]|uniref:Transmembrane protein n=1 Tax=Steccherinum ochraceum TaxID=92696 RepID=A0A4R0R743_9APHY|nr:hypothetical protein EIP91_005401 [Steccherinum ochraceum]